MNGTVTTTVKKCARCHGNHQDLAFHKLTHPMVVDFEIDGFEGKRTYHYWAMCPEKNEPILMEVSETA
jgi:hypothetical protein